MHSEPSLIGLSQRQLYGVAWIAARCAEPAHKHQSVPDACSFHNQELEALFGRGRFPALNRQYGILKVVGESNGRQTTAYRVAQHLDAAVAAALDAANNADRPMVLVRADGYEMDKPLPTLDRASLGRSSIWRAANINLAVPVPECGMAALADLDVWLARLEQMSPGCRGNILRELKIEPHTSLYHLRRYLRALRRNLLSAVAGRGLLVLPYEMADAGRLFEVGCGFQGAHKVIRRCALHGCWDNDIETCHPAIIQRLARSEGERAEVVEDYTTHKDDRRAEIAGRTGITERQAKNGMNAVSYGSRRRCDDEHEIYDGVTAALMDTYGEERGKELAAAFWADDYVRRYRKDVERVGRVIEKAWRRGRGYIRNAAGCIYTKQHRHENNKSDTWSTRLAHIVQGYEALALHAVVTKFPDDILIMAHDGWVSRREMDTPAVEGVIERAVGFRLGVAQEQIRMPKLLHRTPLTSNVKIA